MGAILNKDHLTIKKTCNTLRNMQICKHGQSFILTGRSLYISCKSAIYDNEYFSKEVVKTSPIFFLERLHAVEFNKIRIFLQNEHRRRFCCLIQVKFWQNLY